MDFILSDESINSYGYRVLTNGIDISQFAKNPIMLYNHRTHSSMPIGKWENIRKEGGKLIATAIFDENEDVLAKQVKSKVEQGILNAVSIGFDVVETSADLALMKPGQTRPTVTKSKIFEASIVPFPSNGNALKLRFESQGLTLSGDVPENIIEQLLPSLKQIRMKNLLSKLGLPETATEEQAISELDKITAERQNALAAQQDALIKLGREKGVINDSNEANYKKLAAADYTAILSIIESATPAAQQQVANNVPQKTESIAEALAKAGNKPAAATGKESWSFDDWQRKDQKGLLAMKLANPEKYKELVQGYTPQN
jgi:HK97 family phage prohead protease